MLFNRKKQVGVSLFLAITVFISCMGFSWLKQTQFNYDPGYDYSLNISSYSIYSGSVNFPAYEKGISSSGIARLQSSPYIKEAYGCASCNAFLESDSMLSDYITTAYGRPLDIAFDNGSYDEIGTYADKIIADKANLNSVLTKAISDKCADAKQQFGLSSNSVNINVAIMDYAGIEMLAKYAESGWKSVKFGVLWKMLTPYAHCKEPLKIKHYKIAVLAPLVLVGLLPALVGVILGDAILTIFGILMSGSAAGDIMIYNIIKKENPEDYVQDHPSEAGCWIYRKN